MYFILNCTVRVGAFVSFRIRNVAASRRSPVGLLKFARLVTLNGSGSEQPHGYGCHSFQPQSMHEIASIHQVTTSAATPTRERETGSAAAQEIGAANTRTDTDDEKSPGLPPRQKVRRPPNWKERVPPAPVIRPKSALLMRSSGLL